MPRGYSGGGGLAVTVSGVDWDQVAAALRDGPKEIRLEFNRRTRQIAQPVIVKMKAAVMGTSASAGSTGGASAARSGWLANRGRGPMTARQFGRFGGGTGLRAAVAGTLRVSRRAGGQLAGFRIDAEGSRMPGDQRKLPAYMDVGRWAHPVMGNTHAWVTQTVTPTGWFTKTARESLPLVREQAIEAIDEALDKVAAHVDAAG